MIQITTNECNGNTKLEELKNVLINSTKLDEIYETEFNARVDEWNKKRAEASVRVDIAYRVCEAMSEFIKSCCDQDISQHELNNMLSDDEFKLNFMGDEKDSKIIVDSYKLIETIHRYSYFDDENFNEALWALVNARREHYKNRMSEAVRDLSHYVFTYCGVNITELELSLEEALEERLVRLGVMDGTI